MTRRARYTLICMAILLGVALGMWLGGADWHPCDVSGLMSRLC